MMGFEPTTFCMASVTNASHRNAAIPLQPSGKELAVELPEFITDEAIVRPTDRRPTS